MCAGAGVLLSELPGAVTGLAEEGIWLALRAGVSWGFEGSFLSLAGSEGVVPALEAAATDWAPSVGLELGAAELLSREFEFAAPPIELLLSPDPTFSGELTGTLGGVSVSLVGAGSVRNRLTSDARGWSSDRRSALRLTFRLDLSLALSATPGTSVGALKASGDEAGLAEDGPMTIATANTKAKSVFRACILFSGVA